jgi:hypothetical protein
MSFHWTPDSDSPAHIEREQLAPDANALEVELTGWQACIAVFLLLAFLGGAYLRGEFAQQIAHQRARVAAIVAQEKAR